MYNKPALVEKEPTKNKTATHCAEMQFNADSKLKGGEILVKI
jgi:hypothetical protein